MTSKKRQESITYIKSQLKDGYLDIGGVHEEEEIKILKEALSALIVLEQVRWERDIALFQLGQLGLSLGQKIDGVYLSKEEYEELKNR